MYAERYEMCEYVIRRNYAIGRLFNKIIDSFDSTGEWSL